MAMRPTGSCTPEYEMISRVAVKHITPSHPSIVGQAVALWPPLVRKAMHLRTIVGEIFRPGRREPIAVHPDPDACGQRPIVPEFGVPDVCNCPPARAGCQRYRQDRAARCRFMEGRSSTGCQLLADTETAEDPLQHVVGVNRADHLADLLQSQPISAATNSSCPARPLDWPARGTRRPAERFAAAHGRAGHHVAAARAVPAPPPQPLAQRPQPAPYGRWSGSSVLDGGKISRVRFRRRGAVALRVHCHRSAPSRLWSRRRSLRPALRASRLTRLGRWVASRHSSRTSAVAPLLARSRLCSFFDAARRRFSGGHCPCPRSRPGPSPPPAVSISRHFTPSRSNSAMR